MIGARGDARRRASSRGRVGSVSMAAATVHIDCPGVYFEKWHALGNDYLIVEADALPFDLTAERVRALCAPHTGVFADGILLLSASDERGYLARLRIFNPDGSEAELSGNGAREAVLYLRRRGWATTDTFSIQTAAGEIRPTITSPTTARLDIGRVRLRSADYPSGAVDGAGSLTADGREWRFQHVQVGNPQCAIHVPDVSALEALDLPAIGSAIERHELFPQRTNVSWYAVLDPHRIRASDLRARRGRDLGQRYRRHRRGGGPRAGRRRVPGHGRPRRRRAGGRGGGGPPRYPERLGGAGVLRHARR